MKTSMLKSDVVRVNQSHKLFHTRFFLFKSQLNSLAHTRIAFAFSRKSGNAVLRNLFKRRLREMVKKHCQAAAGYDYLCIAKRPMTSMSEAGWQAEEKKIREWFENN